MTLRRTTTAALALPLAALLVVPLATTATAATDGDVTVVNTETVQARLDATGRLREARLYEQLSFTGTGTAEVTNPTSTAKLRNLDTFGGFSVGDGVMTARVQVDGEKRLRTVSDYSGDLPVSVRVEYLLDGEPVSPRGVVGRSGTLEARYTVTNLTARQDDVTYDDGTGTQVTTKAETVIPMVGQLTTVLPPSFTAVSSDEASVAGDGRGGTRLSFTMTLFPPIGSPTAEFGWTAQIRDGVVPPANVSVLPVNPLASPSFKGGAASYAGGAESGIALTAGATEIDANLLRLHDGAVTLLDGLKQLEEGARALAAGLNDTAVPGAAQLADGAGDLDDGARELRSGARTLHAGTAQLVDGAFKADAGAKSLAEGSARLDTGAKDLAAGAQRLDAGLSTAGTKAPALLAGLQDVKDGLDKVDAGLAGMHHAIGELPDDAKPLHDGVAELKAGVAGLRAGIGRLQAGADLVQETSERLGGLLAALGTMTIGMPRAGNEAQLDAFALFLKGVAAEKDPDDPVEDAERRALLDLADSYENGPMVDLGPGLRVLGGVLSTGVVPGMWQIKCGLGGLGAATTTDVCGGETGLDGGLLQVDGGLDRVDAGVTQLVDEVVAKVRAGVGEDGDTAEDETLRGGIGSLSTGTGQLLAGAGELLAGLGELAAGASALSAGASTLADGTGTLRAGASQLADGTGQLHEGADALRDGAGRLSDGTGRLADGTDRLAAGSSRLAAGLRDAGDGSQQLAEGLTTAAEGAPALADGAKRLSEEGTSVLVDTGAATAADYGVKYAVIEAGAQRAIDEGMAFGSPEGAVGMTAWSLDLAGVDGSGTRSMGRGIVAAALFGLAALAVPLRRRFL